MGSATDLESTVARVLASGRVGTPCAVRWLVRHGGGAANAKKALGAAESACAGWFGAPPSGRHTAGSTATGHVVATLSWAGGQTAILTVTPGGASQADDLVVLGSRGAIYYETPAHGAAQWPTKPAPRRPAVRKGAR